MQKDIEKGSIPDFLLYGVAIAAIGGPLALITLNFFTSSYSAGSYSIYATLLGIVIFLAPLAVWYKYSKNIASAGGLYTFVEKALGTKAAKVQGWIWLISYFLYLPYTVSYITYSLIPVMFPHASVYLPFIEIAMSIVLVLALVFSFRKVLYFITITAILQLAIILAIAFAMLSGGFVNLPAAGVALPTFVVGTLLTSLLFVCASLPLFLGGEARGGAKSIRKALVLSFVVAAVFLVIGTVAFIGATAGQTSSEFQGFSVLLADIGPHFAIFVGIFTIISAVDLIIFEYIAISRVSYAMLNVKLNKSIPAVGALFIILSVIGIINPDFFYDATLVGALIALYLSLLITFVAYPFFAKKQGRLQFTDIFIAVVSSLLMLFGLYIVVAPLL
jgi:amino acid transporter